MDPVLVGFIVYLAVVLIAGGLTYRLNKTQEDFLLAGRRLNVWVATFSERASGESAWLLLGLPAMGMVAGLVKSWAAIGCVSGIVFAWFAIAKGLRRETEKYGALTLPEYFSQRFGEQTNRIRYVATLIIVFFYAFYVAAQFNGAGTVLLVTFEIPKTYGIMIAAGVIVLYTMMGGFFAVAWTDLIQAMIMLGTLVLLPIVGLVELSNSGLSVTDVFAFNPGVGSLTRGASGMAAFAAIVGGLSWGLGYCGQPHTVTRFMSIRDPEDIKKARIIAFFWAAPAFFGSLLIGLVAANLYAAPTFDPDQVMPMMATQLLPGWLAGIFISGAIAAMMSTADSQLLVGTSAIAEDLVHRARKRKLSPAALVRLSRAVTIGIGIAGFILALKTEKLIFAMVSYAWAGLGASFGPALLLTLHWKRTTGFGVLCGMLTGSIGTIIWSEIPALDGAITARVAAFVLATIAVVIGSLADNKE